MSAAGEGQAILFLRSVFLAIVKLSLLCIDVAVCCSVYDVEASSFD